MSERCIPGDPRICNLNRLSIEEIDLIIFEIDTISTFVENQDFEYFNHDNLMKLKEKCIERRKQLFERNLKKQS